METFDLNMLATIKEDPVVTKARRRRFVELFGVPRLSARSLLREVDGAKVIRLDARRHARGTAGSA